MSLDVSIILRAFLPTTTAITFPTAQPTAMKLIVFVMGILTSDALVVDVYPCDGFVMVLKIASMPVTKAVLHVQVKNVLVYLKEVHFRWSPFDYGGNILYL